LLIYLNWSNDLDRGWGHIAAARPVILLTHGQHLVTHKEEAESRNVVDGDLDVFLPSAG
jgi:hypothetical protein